LHIGSQKKLWKVIYFLVSGVSKFGEIVFTINLT